MSKKSKKILIFSFIGLLVALGVLTAIFYQDFALSSAIKNQDYKNVDKILSHSNISDEKVLKFLSKDGVIINDQLAAVVVKNCIGDKKRYKTLSYIANKKGDSFLINGKPAIFSCLSDRNADWNAATILLNATKNIEISDKGGLNLLTKSIVSSKQYKQEDVKEYFDSLFSKNLSKLIDKDNVLGMLSSPAISDEQCLNVITKYSNLALNNKMSGLIAENSIKNKGRYNVLEYISNKLKGKINFDGSSVIFRCLDAEKPNWEAANILLVDLKNANIKDDNNICLLSRSIIAAGYIENKISADFFDQLFKKNVNYSIPDNSGNVPMHYAFKYKNKAVIKKLLLYITQKTQEVDLCYAKNNEGKFPWEFANTEVDNVVDCLIEAKWFLSAQDVASWGDVNDKINADTCIKMADMLEYLSVKYERNNRIEEAMVYCYNELSYINSAQLLLKDKKEKTTLKNRKIEISNKFKELKSKLKVYCYDANGNQIHVGDSIFMYINKYELIGNVIKLPSNGIITVKFDDADMLTKISLLSEAYINAGMKYNNVDKGYEKEKVLIFEKYPYGKTVNVESFRCRLF